MRKDSNLCVWAVAVALFAAVWVGAAYGQATATIDSPTESALTTDDDTDDITFSGSTGGTAQLAYWAIFPGSETDPDLILWDDVLDYGQLTVGAYSVTVTLNASEAGEAYVFAISAYDGTGMVPDDVTLVLKAITLTKNASCDPSDFLCQAQVVFDVAEVAINAVLDDALADIVDLLTVPYDQDDVDAAWAIQDTADSTANAIKDQAESDAQDLKDMASGQMKGTISNLIAQWKNDMRDLISDWVDQTDDTISDAENVL